MEEPERGRVRHRVVANLGRKDELKESGQLEKLAGAFARLDPPLAGTRREVGALRLAEHFLRELDVAGVIDRALPGGGGGSLPADYALQHPGDWLESAAAAIELIEDTPELDLILCPVGGGGLLCGTAIAAKALRPGIRVVALN